MKRDTEALGVGATLEGMEMTAQRGSGDWRVLGGSGEQRGVGTGCWGSGKKWT